MIRSDYRAAAAARMAKLPGPLRLTPSFPFAGRARELATLRTLIPRADGEGLQVRADRRRGRIGQEPARSRVRAGRGRRRRARAVRRLRLGGADVPTGPSSRRSTSSCATSMRGRCRPISGRTARSSRASLPDLAQRFGERPLPVAADPGHRAPPSARRGGRPAGRRRPERPPRGRDRGWPLGRHADAAAPAPPGARGRRGARAGGHHVSRHRGRGPGGAVGHARGPAPLRGGGPAAPGRAERRGDQ